MATEVGGVLSVDELLARSKAAVAKKSTSSGGSKIQQMLAGREESDSVNLSPVAKLLQSQKTEAAKASVPFTEQDWYLNAKVAQLKGQIQTYSNLPGLDPSGAIMDGLTKEVNALVTKQQAKIRASSEEAAKKQAELDKLNAEKANAPIDVDTLLKNAKLRSEGKEPTVAVSKEVQALLDKAKNGVNTTA